MHEAVSSEILKRRRALRRMKATRKLEDNFKVVLSDGGPGDAEWINLIVHGSKRQAVAVISFDALQEELPVVHHIHGT